MSKSKIYLSPPHMGGREQDYIKEAFDSNWIAPLGPHVDLFEKEMANYLGVKDAAAVNSGTAAIHLALSLLNVKRGDTVLCSTLTFVASANPILYQGAKPVFIDSEPDTWNMSPLALRKALNEMSLKGKLPKAVIIVHLYGQSAKMDELQFICNYYGVPIIEDAAESFGSTYKEKSSGTMGRFGVLSFNGNKIITTSGGGMLVSNDVKAIEKARFLATQSREIAPHYQHSQVGFNYRMSNILAGVGRAQLQLLGERVEAKRNIFTRYYNALAHLPGINFMPELNGTKSNRWLTTFTLNEMESGVSTKQLLEALQNENIEARPTWKPLHMQPLFKECSYYTNEAAKNTAEKVFASGICLPSGTSLSEQEQHRVIHCIQDVFRVEKTIEIQESVR